VLFSLSLLRRPEHGNSLGLIGHARAVIAVVSRPMIPEKNDYQITDKLEGCIDDERQFKMAKRSQGLFVAF